MTIGIALALVIGGIVIYEIYEKIQPYQFLKKSHPEYMRDRNKRLEVGQVWIHVMTTRTITDVSGNCIMYEYHIPPNPVSHYEGYTASMTTTTEEFRGEINRYRLHLANPGKSKQLEAEMMHEHVEYQR